MQKNLSTRPLIATGLVLMVPFIMTIVDRNKAIGEGWDWSPSDFLVMGFLIFIAGLTYEILARKLNFKIQRVAIGLLILGAVLAIWVELAVDGISQLASYLFG